MSAKGDHSTPEIEADGSISISEMSAMDALAVLVPLFEEVIETNRALAKRVDRLAMRITNPDLEKFNKKQAAVFLECSERAVQSYARLWRDGDHERGLEHFYREGRGGKVWVTTRAMLERFQRARRVDHA